MARRPCKPMPKLLTDLVQPRDGRVLDITAKGGKKGAGGLQLAGGRAAAKDRSHVERSAGAQQGGPRVPALLKGVVSSGLCSCIDTPLAAWHVQPVQQALQYLAW